MSEMKCKRCGAKMNGKFTIDFLYSQIKIMDKYEEALCNHSIPDKKTKEQCWEDFKVGQAAATQNYADALYEIQDLQNRIAELEEKQRWIPASERMPEDGEHVLAAYVDTMLTAAYYRHHIAFGGVDNWWDVGEGWHTGNPTHWLPLPPNPESPNDTQTQTIVYGKESEE